MSVPDAVVAHGVAGWPWRMSRRPRPRPPAIRSPDTARPAPKAAARGGERLPASVSSWRGCPWPRKWCGSRVADAIRAGPSSSSGRVGRRPDRLSAGGTHGLERHSSAPSRAGGRPASAPSSSAVAARGRSRSWAAAYASGAPTAGGYREGRGVTPMATLFPSASMWAVRGLHGRGAAPPLRPISSAASRRPRGALPGGGGMERGVGQLA